MPSELTCVPSGKRGLTAASDLRAGQLDNSVPPRPHITRPGRNTAGDPPAHPAYANAARNLVTPAYPCKQLVVLVGKINSMAMGVRTTKPPRYIQVGGVAR